MKMFTERIFLFQLTHNSGPLHRVIRAGAARRSTNASLMPRRTNCKPITRHDERGRSTGGGERREGSIREREREEERERERWGINWGRQGENSQRLAAGESVNWREGPRLTVSGWEGGGAGGGGRGGWYGETDEHAVTCGQCACTSLTGDRLTWSTDDMSAGVD